MKIVCPSLLFLTLTLMMGCISAPKQSAKNLEFHYEILFTDLDEKPIDAVNVDYTIKNIDSIRKQGGFTTPANGLFTMSVTATADPQYDIIDSFRSTLEFKASKAGFFSKNDKAIFDCIKSKYQKNGCIDTHSKTSVTLIRPADYFNKDFTSKSSDKKLQDNIFNLIDLIVTQGLVTNSTLQTRSIGLTEFKGNNYLKFKFNNENLYNSFKLNKYDIGKILFDEVIRKLLNPLNDHIGHSNLFYGYDISLIAVTKDLVNSNSKAQYIEYRFIMPEKAVTKYKEKDISGQQLLEASVILMDDERIDLKLQ